TDLKSTKPRHTNKKPETSNTKWPISRLAFLSRTALVETGSHLLKPCPAENMNIDPTRPVYESVAGIFKRTVRRRVKRSLSNQRHAAISNDF
ncbi:hypothetical protein, partial [Trueperella pyogenes]|uniref:hypothetical protein n=1 Tax=Trueperella pyogenes TaxID=1661 RepID=UPI00345D772C